MSIRFLFLASGLLIASFSLASADTITGRVIKWDAVTRSIKLDDKSNLAHIPKTVPLRQDLKVGDQVTIEYESEGDNGGGVIYKLTIINGKARCVVCSLIIE
jgi:translation initiation factor IF-1